jgi:polar amino acid transport system substrate-binding protein
MRRLALLPLVLVLALLLAGCGGEDVAEDVPEPEVPAAEEEPDFGTNVEGQLTVGSDIPFPPFEYRDADGELTGFDVDLIEEIAERLGLETNWIETDFDTIFTQLAAGRFDVVASATTITEERAEMVNFTDPYYLAQQALVVNVQETPDLQAVEDLGPGDVVAVQSGTTGEAWARENVPEGVDVRSFPNAPDTYIALEAGNVTAVIFDEPSAVSEAADRDELEMVTVLDTGEQYGFAVNPENEELLDAMNRVLQELIADGTYAEIYGRYEDLPPGGRIDGEQDTGTDPDY